ncbi:hypothetical protein Tco_0395368, partial [Tanacetum coccineum]
MAMPSMTTSRAMLGMSLRTTTGGVVPIRSSSRVAHKSLIVDEFFPVNEMQKLETEFWNHAMVGAGHAAYTDRFHELARLVHHLKAGTLTEEAVRNGSLEKNPEMRGNGGEP